MNAGAYGADMAGVVLSSKYLAYSDLEPCEIDERAHFFGYRDSVFCGNRNIILSTKLKLEKYKQEKIKEKMNANMESRKKTQPINFPNAGSVFKREKDFIAAKVIDECRLKGCHVGDAEVSNLHSGFIINKGNAKAKDVLELINHIEEEVYKATKKRIELEIEIVGED